MIVKRFFLRKVLSILVIALSLHLNAFSVFGQNEKFFSGRQPPKLEPGIGFNKHELLGMYFGVYSWLIPKELTRDVGRKAMADARSIGVGYFRVACGYGSADLDFWQKHPEVYWDGFDQMMEDLANNGMKAILVLNWDVFQFPDYTKETVKVFLNEPNSKSRLLFSKYVGEVVARYRNHRALLFWELTNEWNLHVELDNDRRYRITGANITTEELTAFTAMFAGYVKSIDFVHLISSGFSLPRRSAEHLRRQPEWSSNGPDWRDDTIEEFEKNILDLHKDVEIISIHFYNTCPNLVASRDCPGRDNLRFGFEGIYNTQVLDVVKSIADKAGKLVMVGEIGDQDDRGAEPQAFFTQACIEKIAKLRISYSAIWAWELYDDFTTKPNIENSVEPGYTDELIAKIKEVNIFLGRPIPWFLTSPRVILTFPYEGSQLFLSPMVYAVASDDDGIERVEFWIDNVWLGTDFSPPYTISLTRGTYPVVGGFFKVKARAFDKTGNSSEYSVKVRGIRFF